MRGDEENLILARSTQSVDEINAKFYGRFQYPYPPVAFDKPVDADFEVLMLNQSLGGWDHSRVPTNPSIWVAGCGTNQAIFTALRFTKANIIATDLSAQSLGAAASNARSLGISNVEFKQESINKASYMEQFDYIICTGVIHHNADPKEPLRKLAMALKKEGVLELMVYNRYHRIVTTAVQKAIRLFGGIAEDVDLEIEDLEIELLLVKKLIAAGKLPSLTMEFLERYKDRPEAELADALLQPVEYNFTVESLDELATSCGLELLVPCINQYDRSSDAFNWNLEFGDPVLQSLYDDVPDLRRWGISNHLMLDGSPLLWFYLHRKDSKWERKSERQLCQEFLDLRFRKSNTKKMLFTRAENGEYVQDTRSVPHPGYHKDELCRRIIAAVDSRPTESIRGLLQQLGVQITFSTLNKIRLYLTTNAFPFLVANY